MSSRPLLRVEVPIRTVSEANQREHWTDRNRRKKSQQEATLLALHGSSLGRMMRVAAVGEGVDVHLTRYASRALDSDNLVGSMKHVRDAIAYWLGIDDGEPAGALPGGPARCGEAVADQDLRA